MTGVFGIAPAPLLVGAWPQAGMSCALLWHGQRSACLLILCASVHCRNGPTRRGPLSSACLALCYQPHTTKHLSYLPSLRGWVPFSCRVSSFQQLWEALFRNQCCTMQLVDAWNALEGAPAASWPPRAAASVGPRQCQHHCGVTARQHVMPTWVMGGQGGQQAVVQQPRFSLQLLISEQAGQLA